MKKPFRIQILYPGIVLMSAAMVCPSTAEAANSGVYLGGAVGQSEFDEIGELSDACIAAGVRCTSDDTDTGFKLFVGYQFGNYLALEGGYANLGELKAGVATPVLAEAALDVHGGFVSILPQVPIGDLGAVYGRLGLMVGDGELTARVPSIGFDDSDSGSVAGVTFGFGGALHLGMATVRVEFERYSFDEAFNIAGEDFDAPDIDLFSGSLLFRF